MNKNWVWVNKVHMKRLISIVILAIIKVVAYAQRGKVRPEWDFDGGHNVLRHDTKEDMWSFLLINGAVALFFLYYYIKENSKRFSKKNNLESNSYNTREEIDYSGEYIKMGYSSSMPLDDEEILSDNYDTIAIEPQESNYDKWTDTGKTYILRDIWESQNPSHLLPKHYTTDKAS